MNFEKTQEAIDKIGEFIANQFSVELGENETVSELWAHNMSEIVASYARLIEALS